MQQQGYLQLISKGDVNSQACLSIQDKIIKFTRELIRIQSRGDKDRQGPILELLRSWLESRGLKTSLIERSNRTKFNIIGLHCQIGDHRKGETYCLAACADTAPFGNIGDWSRSPTAAYLDSEGWLYGRGAADSKSGLAIFAHIIEELSNFQDKLQGRVILFADGDEHSGRFQSVKQFLSIFNKIDGVYIGYPGHDQIRVGARGFYRVDITTFGHSSHTGASIYNSDNAIYKALKIANCIERFNFQHSDVIVKENFNLRPKMTVTGIHSGFGYSYVPDKCVLKIDVRLTPKFTRANARKYLTEFIEQAEAAYALSTNVVKKTEIKAHGTWPAYILGEKSPIVSTLQEEASKQLNFTPKLTLSGPSNVGNYFSSKGIEATCGFGVSYKNIHSPDECINTNTIMPVYNAYLNSMKVLLLDKE